MTVALIATEATGRLYEGKSRTSTTRNPVGDIRSEPAPAIGKGPAYDELSDQARNNDINNFRLVFDRKFLQTIVTRVDANDEIYKKNP